MVGVLTGIEIQVKKYSLTSTDFGPAMAFIESYISGESICAGETAVYTLTFIKEWNKMI
jgi:hypothetical protein